MKIIRKHPPKNELKQENIKSPHWKTELLKILKDTLEDNRIEIRKMITLSQVICGFNRNFIKFWRYYYKNKKFLKVLWNPSKPRRAKSILKKKKSRILVMTPDKSKWVKRHPQNNNG